MDTQLKDDELLCVAPEMVERAWPRVVSFIDAATNHCGDWTTDEIKGAIDSGGLLWVIANGNTIKAAVVTRLIRTPRGLKCEILACGGGGVKWAKLINGIEKYAREEGCSTVRLAGRKGWARIFKDYRLELVVMEKRM